MLLETPPQHGKSLSVIDFIAWAVGHDPELRVIYTSFSDRLSIRVNLRMQRALDNPVYQRIFPNTKIEAKGGGRALRNTTPWNLSTPTATSAIPPWSARSRARRSIRGQWSALEREEKIKFWAERDRNNSRLGAYDVGVEHGIVSQLANASGHGRDFDEHRFNFMLSVIKGIEPRNQLEAMLAAQMAAPRTRRASSGPRASRPAATPNGRKAVRWPNAMPAAGARNRMWRPSRSSRRGKFEVIPEGQEPRAGKLLQREA
jgi:hypothetical protein